MSSLVGKKMRVWLAAFAVLCVGLAVGVVFGSPIQDADAARRPLLKTLWAVVDADGTIDNSKGVITSQSGRFNTGTYDIVFNRNVSRCASVATIEADDGEIGAQRLGGAPNMIRIFTSDSSGTAADSTFSLVVNC